MRLLAFTIAVMATIASSGINRADAAAVSVGSEHRRLCQPSDETGMEADSPTAYGHDSGANLPGPAPEGAASERSESNAKSDKLQFALKNNIVYDAILMPNLELEWLFNKDWSASIEGDVAWWKPSFDHIYRLAIISPEVRYHFRQRGPWHGMYAGAFLGGGLYQLEKGGPTGHRGEGVMAGLSFGYMWPIGRHFSLEAGIGAGYMYTRYKDYENRGGHKVYLRTKSLNYFGPLKLKFSIAWRFDITTGKVKDNSTL